MSNQGWFILHRKLQNNWLWNNSDTFDKRSAWIDLIMMAYHSEKKVFSNGVLLTVQRGQFPTSIRFLAERWKWSKDKVYRFLNLLEQDGMIIKQSDTERTLITLVNYGLYQDVKDTNKSSGKDTDKESDKDTDWTPTSQHTGTDQVITNNSNEFLNNSNNGGNTELPPLNLKIEKAWYGTFKEYPNKDNPTSAQRTWAQIISEYPPEEHYDVSVLIAKAIQFWKADYKVHNLNDPNGRFAKEFSEWLKDDLRFWIQEAKEQGLQKETEKAKAAADNVGMTEEEWNSLPDYRTD